MYLKQDEVDQQTRRLSFDQNDSTAEHDQAIPLLLPPHQYWALLHREGQSEDLNVRVRKQSSYVLVLKQALKKKYYAVVKTTTSSKFESDVRHIERD